MLERLEHAFRRGRRSGKSSAVFCVDLDEFKAVNDRYGHRVGDELLVAVARRLTAILRPGDSLARLAGDEFVILCEDLDEPSQADPIAVRIGEEMTRPFALSAADVGISASVGIAFTGRGNDAPEDLLDSANLELDSPSHTIVTAIIQLAHGLGMTVISEGVETAEQRHQLVELGCDACQGFYFARPAPASSLEALLERQDGQGTGLPVLPVGGER
jgi:diguanylate cyclase (GGDEF)-like protein